VTYLRPFLTAEWRDLVIANYAVPPTLLLPFIPRGTELDLWEGQAFLSLVGFRFASTRLLGVPLPGHRDFEEVNLRCYVRRNTGGESRRAVVFLRELVPRRAIAWVARLVYNEPYRALPMRHRHHVADATRSFSYEWREHRDWLGVAARVTGEPEALRAGSRAEFIAEHYWGYTAQRDGGTIEYHVAHPRWSVWETSEFQVRGDLRRTYGDSLGAILAAPPDSAYVAVGSPVTVYRPRRLSSEELG
jgi:hypothetical protein